MQLIILGIASGSLSYFSLEIHESTLFFLPGLLFGIAVIIWFVYRFRRKPFGIFIIPVISTGAYYAAVYTVLLEIGDIDIKPDGVIFVLAGVVGSGILLSGVHFLLQRLSVSALIKLILLGGLLGLSIYIHPSSGSITLLPLYLCWQTGMMVGLGYFWEKRFHG